MAVEYNIINLKQTLAIRNNERDLTLMQVLSEYEGDTIYEFECI